MPREGTLGRSDPTLPTAGGSRKSRPRCWTAWPYTALLGGQRTETDRLGSSRRVQGTGARAKSLLTGDLRRTRARTGLRTTSRNRVLPHDDHKQARCRDDVITTARAKWEARPLRLPEEAVPYTARGSDEDWGRLTTQAHWAAGQDEHHGQNCRCSAVSLESKAGEELRCTHLVAGRVLTRVKNTDGSTSTCSPRARFL